MVVEAVVIGEVAARLHRRNRGRSLREKRILTMEPRSAEMKGRADPQTDSGAQIE
jgi:hypothetical protein